jgi:dTDP-4-amino-4,6-dideoxygalactose transaminase
MIPLFKVFMCEEAAQEAYNVLLSGYIGQGERVNQFEAVLSEYIGSKALTVNSGTSALHLALHLAKGDDSSIEVLTSPLTCTATNWPILANGLDLKWVDIDPATMNMDMDDLRSKITEKTKIIMVVHWGGYPVDLDELETIKDETEEKYGFRPIVIEDCAHAFGGFYGGKKIGSHGNFCAFSFQAIKHLTSVDGGMLITPPEYYDRAKLLRWYGIDRETNSKDFRCLHPSTLIRFENGETHKISNVVKDKMTGPFY